MKRWLAIVPLLLFTACTVHVATDNPGTTTRPQSQPIGGLWSIEQKYCGGKAAPLATGSFVKIDSTGTYIAYVSTVEEDSLHICRKIDGYQFLLQRAERSTKSGATDVAIQTGQIKKLLVRHICASKGADTKPYEDKIERISDSYRKASLVQMGSDRLGLDLEHADFCGLGSAHLELVR